jgi:GNAT superfamily N-acetyltransferase
VCFGHFQPLRACFFKLFKPLALIKYALNAILLIVILSSKEFNLPTFDISVVSLEQAKAQEESLAQALADVLLDCVEQGASVSFMWPLAREKALDFWRGVLQGVASGERVLLVAKDAVGQVCGTVQLITAQPDNQPHRADVAKMLVHSRARKQGLGEALMGAVEEAALAAGKTLLVLDTVTNEAGWRLYRRCGWQIAGDVPGYALLPYPGEKGGLVSTTFMYKALTV